MPELSQHLLNRGQTPFWKKHMTLSPILSCHNTFLIEVKQVLDDPEREPCRSQHLLNRGQTTGEAKERTNQGVTTPS